MPAVVSVHGDDVVYRIPAGGAVIYTDETGTELLRVTSVSDAVKVSGQTITAAALAELATLDGLTATVDEINAVADLSAYAQSVTATATGATTGTITGTGVIQHCTVTSGNADHIVVLPAPTPGRIVVLNNGATGYELRSSAPATVAINGGAEADAESAIAANSTVIAICISATAWKAFYLDADSDVAKVAAAAAV